MAEKMAVSWATEKDGEKAAGSAEYLGAWLVHVTVATKEIV